MMSVPSYSCTACRKGKRRCDKNRPSCQRCAAKGVSCRYPNSRVETEASHFSITPTTPASTVFSVFNEQERTSASPQRQSEPSGGNPAHGTKSSHGSVSHQVPTGVPAQSTSPTLEDLQSAWFMLPETWQIVHFQNAIPNRPLNNKVLEESVGQFESWVKNWADRGSNVFVHQNLYSAFLPSPARDVFTTIAAFVHRTPATEGLVFRAVEAHLQALAAAGAETGRQGCQTLQLLHHLAHVQALVAYFTIALFHGNIRLRHVADPHLSLLASRSQSLLRIATQAAADNSLLFAAAQSALDARNTDIDPDMSTTTGAGRGARGSGEPLPSLDAIYRRFGDAEQEATLWRTWIVAESVRRTWTAARAVETVYKLLRDGGGDFACPGGLPFTMRRGVWDASSALDWTRACCCADAGFLHLGQTDKIFAGPVDEFAAALIKLNFRTERAYLWVDQQAESR